MGENDGGTNAPVASIDQCCGERDCRCQKADPAPYMDPLYA